MRLIVGDLELNCPLVAMVDLGGYGKLKPKRSGKMFEKLRCL